MLLPTKFALLISLSILLTTLPEKAESANILIIHAFYSGSPLLTWRTAADYFTQHGHHVHILRWKDTHRLQPLQNPNITETVLSLDNSAGHFYYTLLTKEKEAAFDVPFNKLLQEGLSAVGMMLEGIKGIPILYSACNSLLSNKVFHAQLRAMNFDLAIVDLVANECSLALAHHLKLPTVGFWGMQFSSGETTATTASLNPSYAPVLLSQFTDRMTFPQRVQNFLHYLLHQGTVWFNSAMMSIPIQKYIPGTPHPTTLLADLNGMLINSDHIMDYPQLLPPTFVRVGGLHLRELNKLPEDLDQWMESSGDDGVVVFAVGYTMTTQGLSKKFMNSFMRAVGKFPQKFIMNLEGRFDYVPANVKFMKWIPQQEILAHNKTRLFVTHCGLQGVTESIYYGVPMVGMPIFLDQGDYLIKMLKHGIALGLDRHTANTKEIYQTIHKVLHDPKFKENTMRLSRLMRDTKESSKARALELVEYLIRHKGAPHLKIASRHLNFIQYFSLDVIAFLALFAYVLYKVSKLSFQVVWILTHGRFSSKVGSTCQTSKPWGRDEVILENNNDIEIIGMKKGL